MIKEKASQFSEGLEKARELFVNGDYKSAERKLNELLVYNNQEPEIFQMLATIHYDAGKFNKAIQTFRRALELDPNYTDASVGLSIVLNDLGKYEEGKKVFVEGQARLQKRKNKPDPTIENKIGKKHFELGELYFQIAHYPEAKDQFKLAQKFLSEKEAVAIKVSECFVRNQQPEEAIDELLTYLKRFPDSLQVRLKLGQIYFNHDEGTLAVDQWENVLMRDPDNQIARKYLRMAFDAGMKFL